MKKCIVQMMSPYSGPVTKLSVNQFLLVKASLIKWNSEEFKTNTKKRTFESIFVNATIIYFFLPISVNLQQ